MSEEMNLSPEEKIKAEKEKAAISIKRGGWYFCILIAAFFVMQIVCAYFLPVEGILSVLLPEVIIWALAIGFFVITKQNPLKFMRVKKFHIGSAFLVILVGLLCEPVVTFVNAVSMIFFTNEISVAMTELTKGPYIVAILAMALMPALGEEVTCRGIILNSYDTNRPVKAIFISALCFSLFHMNFNQMSYAFVLGVIMAFLVEATDSIWSSVIIHFMINGISTTMLYLLPYIVKFYNAMMKMSGEGETLNLDDIANQTASKAQLASVAFVYSIPAIICAILIGLLIYLIAYINHREGIFKYWFGKNTKENRKRVVKIKTIYPPMIVAIVLCVVMAVWIQLT